MTLSRKGLRLVLAAVLVFLLPAPLRANTPPAQVAPPATPPADPSHVFGGSEAAHELWAAQSQYEAKKKSAALSFALELAAPSLGNFYAGESEDAVLTLTGLMIGGFFLLDGYGVLCRTVQSDDSGCKRKTFSLVQGWLFLVGSRLFGLSSAPTNALRANRALRARLGLDEGATVSLAPFVARNEAGLGLQLLF